MARELQQFHLRQRNAQQLEVIRQRRSIGKLLGEGCLRVEGLPGRGPSPQGAPSGREHLPSGVRAPSAPIQAARSAGFRVGGTVSGHWAATLGPS